MQPDKPLTSLLERNDFSNRSEAQPEDRNLFPTASLHGHYSPLTVSYIQSFRSMVSFSAEIPLAQDMRTLVFLLLLLLLAKTMKGLSDEHSLCYNITVMTWTSPEQPWYEVQGLVDGKLFFRYDSGSNQARALGAMKERVKTTEAWEDQINTLRRLGQELRICLSDITQNYTATAPMVSSTHLPFSTPAVTGSSTPAVTGSSISKDVRSVIKAVSILAVIAVVIL
ncbi:UL16-binding protein 2-like isoform X3 [Echinops telfairi]|uniref:UL16-binding protein 2-like isoform X3 n=1 Tax=Echinops telfairi TaxID=9371 RepID=A0AC55DFB3_ECHTE|nr:UL16-binding protein 2-like isoform X3 [Echinops telfairi]